MTRGDVIAMCMARHSIRVHRDDVKFKHYAVGIGANGVYLGVNRIIGPNFTLIKRGYKYFPENSTMHMHAEVDALEMASLRRDTIRKMFILRINNTGGLRNATPCGVCMQLMREHGVREIDVTLLDEWFTRFV